MSNRRDCQGSERLGERDKGCHNELENLYANGGQMADSRRRSASGMVDK